MIILLTLIVLGLSKVLWWLKDYFRRETFSGIPVNAQVPSQDEMLATAYNALPSSDLQQEALATPIVEVSQIEAEYQRDQQAATSSAETTETEFRQSVQNLFQIDPRVPLDQQIPGAAPSGARPGAPVPEAATQEQTAEFQALLTTLNQNALDHCFQQSCASIQASQDEACRGFAEQCFYRLDRNVVNCLKSLDDRCSTAGLDACRMKCQESIQMSRNILRQDEPLLANHRLTSVSGSTHLILRDTGLLELYYRSRLIWTTATRQTNLGGTLNQGPYQLLIDPNGHMSIKNGIGMETWRTNSWTDPLKSGSINAPYQLVVSDQRAALLNKNGAILWDSQAEN